MRRRILTLTEITLLILFGISSVYSQQQHISMGFEDGWQQISQFSGTRLQKGRHGFLDITLEPGQYDHSTPHTDLLMHFENSQTIDATGNYSMEHEGDFSIVPDGRVGFFAGKFSGFRGGISLVPVSSAKQADEKPLFTPGTLGNSFSIEFQLSPYYLEEGEIILQWNGQKEHQEVVQLQSLTCSVQNRRLEWRIKNLFLPPDQGETEFILRGRKAMVPEKWHHHMLRYHSDTGVLEYLVDGIPAEITYCTEDGTPSGSVMRPYIGERSTSELDIAPQFTGKIDELRISRSYIDEPMLHGLASTGGYAIAGPIDLGQKKSNLNAINVEYKEPDTSKSFFYYRIDQQNGWTPFEPGEKLQPSPTGRYLELKFHLYPDGSGSHSPQISSATVRYRPNLPPPSPTGLTATPGNGKIEVSWDPIQQTDLEGYIVYYGTSSGEYRATVSNAGASPIDARNSTNITLDGVENGTLYYIAVAAYDTAGRTHRSTLSQEVSARPSAFYGD